MRTRPETLAAAAHLAVFLSAWGLPVPGGLWLTARPHSYLRHHAGQALAYQAGAFGTLTFVTALLPEGPPVSTLIGLAHLGIMAYGAFAAFTALEGRRFRYLG